MLILLSSRVSIGSRAGAAHTTIRIGADNMDEALIKGIRNFYCIDENLCTGGQPSKEQLAAVRDAGFEVVINLALHDDPVGSLPGEPGHAASLGMEYIHIPVRLSSPTRQDLEAFFRAMTQCAGRKVFLHCALNKRVSAFLGLYRAIELKQPTDEAFRLMHRIWKPDAVWKAFIAEMLGAYHRAGDRESAVSLSTFQDLTGGDNMTQVETEIRNLLEKHSDAYARKDIPALMSCYSQDADMVNVGSSDNEVYIGATELQKAFETFFGQVRTVGIEYAGIRLTIKQPLAWLYADVPVNVKMDQGEINRKGRMTAVLEKRDNRWLFVQTHFSFPVAD
jgi:uncharacterized protein (TIGR02246 family)